MKYYVQANRHYLVTVDAESALSAEHRLLDLDGIQYSNAFDNEGRKTDTFRGALLDCNTVSFEELEKISEQYTEAVESVDGAKKLVQDAQQSIKRLRNQLAAAETFHQRALENLRARERELYWAKVGIGLEEIPEQLKGMVV